MALLFIFTLGLLAIAALLLPPLLRRRRRQRLMAQPFPQAWRRILRRRVPQVASLPADLQLRLKGLIQVFLAEKPIIGCDGLTVTDEMRVTIAAQACLPLLGAPRSFYPRLNQILLYPAAFVVDRPVNAPGGVLQEQRRALAGESWVQGQVLLSWQDVVQGAADPADGQNVVIHEFAHQLDQLKGHANGAPLLRDRAAYQRWSEVMQAEYQALQWRCAEGLPSLLNPYGATDPAEFFAVASEVFFEQPGELQALHPALYAELGGYYRLDPAAWS
ncbi:M90 family metallopeptidase [Pelomonas sp. SE-A7]|uniref:M90 family metallopeptidase n=1 Tax=Pelomonas sp. SE-A7 TaxID=3054953 RepID=UPI00259D0488|nr:M90 family metallopeptidase [Pelomonas sp. SE-A7]MDM4766471.1 zinc-dependent peptidase [Pelomonas sp. SE-A7]